MYKPFINTDRCPRFIAKIYIVHTIFINDTEMLLQLVCVLNPAVLVYSNCLKVVKTSGRRKYGRKLISFRFDNILRDH